ncbi:MAG: hypothetical protein ACQESU_01090 [Halobacteriota archaeon]
MKVVKLTVVLIAMIVALAFIPSAMATNTDVKPGSNPNPINLKSNGVVSIAIAGFDGVEGTNLSDINLTTLRVCFYPNGPGVAEVPVLRYNFEDVVNASTPTESGEPTPISGPDGYMDLVVKVEVQALVDAGLWSPEDGELGMWICYERLSDGELAKTNNDRVRIIDNPDKGKDVEKIKNKMKGK